MTKNLARRSKKNLISAHDLSASFWIANYWIANYWIFTGSQLLRGEAPVFKFKFKFKSTFGRLPLGCLLFEKGSVESTHKVPTSHYHAKHSLLFM